MATKIGAFRFKNEMDFMGAKMALYHQMYLDYSNSSNIDYYNSWGYRIIYIFDGCSDPERAGNICRAFHGEPYND